MCVQCADDLTADPDSNHGIRIACAVERSGLGPNDKQQTRDENFAAFAYQRRASRRLAASRALAQYRTVPSHPTSDRSADRARARAAQRSGCVVSRHVGVRERNGDKTCKFNACTFFSQPKYSSSPTNCIATIAPAAGGNLLRTLPSCSRTTTSENTTTSR